MLPVCLARYHLAVFLESSIIHIFLLKLMVPTSNIPFVGRSTLRKETDTTRMQVTQVTSRWSWSVQVTKAVITEWSEVSVPLVTSQRVEL